MDTRKPARRGNATMVSLMAVTLLGFGALAVDIGSALVVRAQLQAAADASALGAVAYLHEHPADYTADMLEARRQAVLIAGLNQANFKPVSLDPNVVNDPDGDVVLGIYDPETHTFTPSLDPVEVNAARVTARISDVGTVFGLAAFGQSVLGVASVSLAVEGPPEGAGKVACFLPLALPTCIFDGRPDEVLNLTDLVLQPATGDNVGWGSLDGQPTPNAIREALGDPCAAGPAAVGDPLYIGNGAEQAALVEVADRIAGSKTSWDPASWGGLPDQMAGSAIPKSQYGHTLEGIVPLFTAGPEYCDAIVGNEHWNASSDAHITGFAWGAAYDVRTKGTAAERNLKLRLDLLSDYEYGLLVGGPDHGVTAEGPDVLVY